MRVPGAGNPPKVLEAALARIAQSGTVIVARSNIVASRPIGPSARLYANAAAVLTSRLEPPRMLARLQAIEDASGRRRRGARWGARTLDLDIVLWSGGSWHDQTLTIPHPRFRQRDFVLAPATGIAPRWRDPITGLTLRQLHARLTRPRPLPRCAGGRALSSVGRATDF
ncbi:2-amino-4-hydroxy-6-hydroxymethyldihydropteridine diphosphokinase [Qipengyuania sp. MTN3-11]|uniref:2-amino-4-hydroxy-6- hydroxymethyldihydropteridine diphosphokinase n=1 Tax=Qipengyuania sp. MTN3-11 TaxID=3056557 RepID=UPI0036F39A51